MISHALRGPCSPMKFHKNSQRFGYRSQQSDDARIELEYMRQVGISLQHGR